MLLKALGTKERVGVSEHGLETCKAMQSDAKRCKASLRLAKRRDVLNCIEAQEFFGMSGCLETDCLDSSPRHEHDASLARLVGK